jgi:hypothetical protein
MSGVSLYELAEGKENGEGTNLRFVRSILNFSLIGGILLRWHRLELNSV